jgi:hypothetical protein
MLVLRVGSTFRIGLSDVADQPSGKDGLAR